MTDVENIAGRLRAVLDRLAGRFMTTATIVALAVVLSVVSINAWRTTAQRHEAELLYAHTFDVLLTTSRMRAATHSELRGERGYLLTHDESFLAPYVQGLRDAMVIDVELSGLIETGSRQRALLERLDAQRRVYEQLLAHTIALERNGGHGSALAIVKAGVGRHHINAILTTLDAIDIQAKVELRRSGAAVTQAMRRSAMWQYALTGIGFLLLILSGIAAWSARRAQRAAAAATEELRRHATTDALTGLANRRAFLVELEARLASGEQMALAIVDVDHFKRVNDGYGHPAGDAVLCAIARIAASSVRGSDLVGRLGGEEFGILMPGTTEAQAIGVCDRFRAAVQDQAMILPGGRRLSVTFSAGVAGRLPDEGADALIHRADRALYDAKECGRNRVLLAA